MLKDLEYLVGLGERRSHAGQTKAASYLKGELSKLSGIKLREHGYTYAGQPYVNLEVTIEGAELPDQHVFAGAHYDSISPDPAKAPGADDNASGTVAVLEIARAMAGCRPRRSVRLLFFSNEEKGIIGAKAYVSSIKATVPKEKLLGMISVDMVAYGPDDEDLDLASSPAQKGFVDEVGAAVEQWTSLKVKKIISDHCG
jgi:Zn-dependent M28 family amino/carboxypeptidase